MNHPKLEISFRFYTYYSDLFVAPPRSWKIKAGFEKYKCDFN